MDWLTRQSRRGLKDKTEGCKPSRLPAFQASVSNQLQRKPCRRLILSPTFSMPCATAINWSKPCCMGAMGRPLKACQRERTAR